MALTNIALLTGATVSATGGTAQTFAPNGTRVNRGISVSDIAVDNVLTQHSIVFKNTPGALQPDGTWSKDRREAKYVIPEVLADGTVDFATLEISMVKSPLRGLTTVNALKEKGAQLVIDADVSNFWATGAIA